MATAPPTLPLWPPGLGKGVQGEGAAGEVQSVLTGVARMAHHRGAMLGRRREARRRTRRPSAYHLSPTVGRLQRPFLSRSLSHLSTSPSRGGIRCLQAARRGSSRPDGGDPDCNVAIGAGGLARRGAPRPDGVAQRAAAWAGPAAAVAKKAARTVNLVCTTTTNWRDRGWGGAPLAGAMGKLSRPSPGLHCVPPHRGADHTVPRQLVSRRNSVRTSLEAPPSRAGGQARRWSASAALHVAQS